jgi:hypothetical protein
MLGRATDDHGMTGQLGDVANLLVAMESACGQSGWDCAGPMMFEVCRMPNSAPSDGYCLVQQPLGDYGEPESEVVTIAAMLRDPLYARDVGATYEFPPVAHAIVFEAWQHVDTVAGWERGNDLYGEDVALVDRPGSVEVRVGFAVTDRSLLVVHRRRGGVPQISHYTQKGDDAWPWMPSLTAALADLDAAVKAAYAIAQEPPQPPVGGA